MSTSNEGGWSDTLTEVVQLVNSSHDFEEVLQLALEGAMRVINAEAGALILLDEVTDELVIKVSAGPKGEAVQGMRFPKEEGIAGWVASNGRPRIVSDVERDRHFFRGIDQNSGFKTRSILAAPLRVKEEMIGVLEVINKRPDSLFDDGDLQRISVFADLAAIAIGSAGAFTELRLENRRLQTRLAIEGAIFGRSPAMWEVVRQIELVADRPVTVLVQGETGTGKGVMAREIHQRSRRRDQPFVAVDCGAISQGLWESELFGHRKGAFTGATHDKQGLFQAADGGTLFLDEIGNTPPELQSRLLNVLQDGEIRRVGETQVRRVDVRLVAATNRNLEDAVQEGTFREDLFFRLNVVPVVLPPLRQRTEEIASLLDFFIDKFNRELDGDIRGVSEAGLQALTAYSWPGNIRELENLAKRLIVLVGKGVVELEQLPPEIRRTRLDAEPVATGATSAASPSPDTPPRSLAEMEQEQIEHALMQTEGNQSRAARLLGISREQIRYRIRKYGIGQ
jgi:Nif-specific regulatory protein